MSRLIISIHIPKTAGTSFGVFLKEKFKEKMVFIIPCVKCKGNVFSCERDDVLKKHKEPCDLHGISLAEVARYVKMNNIECIHGHIRPADIYPYFPQGKYVVWLRTPVERVVSHLEFFRRFPFSETVPSNQLAAVEKNDLREFVSLVGNAQTSWIRNFSLDRFSFIGCVEKFEVDIKRFGDQFGISSASIPRKNVNPNKKSDKYQLDAETRKIIEKANLCDIALYAEAMRIRGQENSLARRGQRFINGLRTAWGQRFPLAGRGMSKVKAYGQKLTRYVKSKL